MTGIIKRNIPRVPGTAVFLTRTERDTPPVMVWHVKHNRVLHEHLFVLRVEIQSLPWASSRDRISANTALKDATRDHGRQLAKHLANISREARLSQRLQAEPVP